ncbi:MAG: CinA family protein [Proteobacteria bacterium]|nr:CinA family protein [Pseudomonadota bacterium]
MLTFPYSDLVNTIANNCIRFKWQLMTAESCTGGMVATALSTPAGASSWFRGSVVAYDNTIKESLLQVDNDTILNNPAHGAVSEACALAMSAGLKKLGADVGVAITGIAGPSGDNSKKPVGLVCFGLITPQQHDAVWQQFAGDRDRVRESATQYALTLLASATTHAT